MKTEVNTRVLFNAKCVLEEDELRALDALVGYGFDAFLKCFYEHMGKAYVGIGSFRPTNSGMFGRFKLKEIL